MNASRVAGVLAAMLVLAALDFIGSICAKEYAERQRGLALVIGVISFVVLFGVYVAALKYAELTIVTMGWVVLLQVAVLAVDHRRYGLHLDARQWTAVALIIALQLYLLVTTSSRSAAEELATVEPSLPPVAVDGPAPAPEHPLAADGRGPGDDPLLRRHPTPFLVVDLQVVAERYAELTAAMPDVAVHYAVKANPAPDVLELLVRLGSSFDVASPGEIAACLAAGARPEHLSYGNTAKKESDIATAFASGVTVFTFDDATELDKLARAAPGATALCRITTSGEGADWALSDKFGCSAERAAELLTCAARAGHPVGVAFHVGSQQRDPWQWDGPLRTVGALQEQLVHRGVTLSMLDIGGGFPATYRSPAPPIERYGGAIAASMGRHLRAPIPRVIAEPGRFLVADAGVIEAEVVLVAERYGRRWVHLDIGLFGGLAEVLEEAIEYRITTDRDGDSVGPVVIAGPTCDSADVLYRRAAYRLPMGLKAGDRVRLLSTGAYTASYSSVGFNGLPPLAYVCVGGRGGHATATVGHRSAVDLVSAGSPYAA